MGYITHHAIIITSWSKKSIEEAHKKAEEIFQNITPVIESNINGYSSFLIPPDGSKEGWEDSDIGDKNRADFIRWINQQAYKDGSNNLSFVEVFYGDENGDAEIVNHN